MTNDLLFEPQRHEPLAAQPWDESRARETLARIVRDTERDFDPQLLWPIHPLDRSPERPPDSMKPLYYGAAGVVWALQYLSENRATTLACDYLSIASTLVERHREDLRKYGELRKYLGSETASYWLGETGMRLLHWKLAPSAKLVDEIANGLEETIGDVRGLSWGGAGAMLAALWMHERTGDSRWSALYLAHFDALWERWQFVDELGCHLWSGELYGVTEHRLGALHGFAANAAAMLRGRALLPPDRLSEMARRIGKTLNATVVRNGVFANWSNNVGATTRTKPLPIFVQYCNGAPGVVGSLAGAPRDSRFPVDDLLLQAGELVWHAGPLVKLPVLCHGTAGNGYAFLKLYARTGDPKWLERARAFAMHSIEQNQRALEQYGQRKYSLWTGDLGLALYLWDCIRGVGSLPLIDVF